MGGLLSFAHKYRQVPKGQRQGGKTRQARSRAKWVAIQKDFDARFVGSDLRKVEICKDLSLKYKITVPTLMNRLRVPYRRKRGEKQR
jgi:hypothetical protein